MLDPDGPRNIRVERGVPDSRGRGPLPPPPELESGATETTLRWKSSASPSPPSGLPRHPLLWAANGGIDATVRGPHGWKRVPRRLENLIRARPFRFESSTPRAAPSVPLPLEHRGTPVVVVVTGGSGGVGRTTLALEVAAQLASRPPGDDGRVLLVDSDPLHADLDTRLGVADLSSMRCPSARLDRVLLALPELAERRVHLDSLLWVDSRSGLQALLSPGSTTAIGREHLDYLYTYFVSPQFEAVVVDGGPVALATNTPPHWSSAFWLSLADSVLVPLRPTASSARAAVQTIRALDQAGVPRARCRLVMGVGRGDRSQAAVWQRQLAEFAVARWPWVPDVAQKAHRAHRPLGELNQRFGLRISSLLPDFSGPRSRG